LAPAFSNAAFGLVSSTCSKPFSVRYDEETFKNRNHKIKQQINQKLRDIREQLNLSRPLQLGCARDCYASTLDRNNTPREKTSQMLGHSNVVITEHYLDGLDPDSTFGINSPIL
jgi:hypothetical protein